MSICLYSNICICLYTYIRLYAMVCDGMRWYATNGYNGMQWYATAYNRLWYFYNVTFLQRDIFTTNLSSGKILLTLSYLSKFFVYDSFFGL